MAITDVFNSLTFGGVNSLAYGIFITGEAVYNAPEREVEMVSIAGRNGDFPLDQGRWTNIEVSYPAGCSATTQAGFATAINGFRNAIASKIGYQRLTDTYHPNEYRMGMYIAGLEVKPVHNSRAGEFEIVFNCKPQRWLTSGEADISVTSGDTITNSTLYDANPLLKVEGYGKIEFNGYSITINDDDIGYIELAPTTRVKDDSLALTFSSNLLSGGDTINVSMSILWFVKGTQIYSVTSMTDSNSDFSTTRHLSPVTTKATGLTFTAGTVIR